MPTLWLHTGLHKTGTTTIQKAMHQNAQALAEQGFFYPATGLLNDNKASWGHHGLAYALRHEKKGREVWQALREEADRSGLPNTVVSSEELSLLPWPTLPGVKPYQIMADAFEGYEIVLLCYLRPQVDMVGALYNHHVKSVGETGDIMDFLSRCAPRLDYIQYLHVASVGLKEARIQVRRYGRDWLEGDILDDLAMTIGLDLSRGFQRPLTALNPGLTVTGIAEMTAANIRLAHDPARLKRERTRLLRKYKAAPYESCNMLSQEARRTIEALYKYKNTQIGRRFMKLDGDLFDPQTRPIGHSVTD